MTTFIKQMQIVQAYLRRKAIRIMRGPTLTQGIGPRQPVVLRQYGNGTAPFEQIGMRHAAQWLQNISQNNRLSTRNKGSDNAKIAANATAQHGERVRMKTLMQQGSIHDRPIILRGIRMLHVVVMLRMHHWKIRAFQLPSLLRIIATQVRRMVKTIFRSYYYKQFERLFIAPSDFQNQKIRIA